MPHLLQACDQERDTFDEAKHWEGGKDPTVPSKYLKMADPAEARRFLAWTLQVHLAVTDAKKCCLL